MFELHGTSCEVIKLIHVNTIVLQYKELVFNLFSSFKKGLICGAKGHVFQQHVLTQFLLHGLAEVKLKKYHKKLKHEQGY